MLFSHKPVGKSFPAKADRCIDAHKKEEWTQQKSIQNVCICNICGDPALLPFFGRKIEQRVWVRECELRCLRAFFPGLRGLHAQFISRLTSLRVILASELKKLEALLLNQVLGNSMFAGADSYFWLVYFRNKNMGLSANLHITRSACLRFAPSWDKCVEKKEAKAVGHLRRYLIATAA